MRFVTMNTLIDGRSYQAALHTGAMGRPQHSGSRLNEFMSIVDQVVGKQPEISDLPLTGCQLNGVDLLIILTRRYTPQFRFSDEEYTGIKDYLSGGGSLLLLTNHAPFAKNDRHLIRRIGKPYGVSVYGNRGHQGQMEIGRDNIKCHPITEEVSSLWFRNSHILSCSSREDVNILATIPELSPPNNVFAVAIEGNGRIVYCSLTFGRRLRCKH